MTDPVASTFPTRSTLNDGDHPLVLTVREAAEMLRISPDLVHREIRAGRLPHVPIGRRRLVPRHALVEWLDRQAAASVRDDAPKSNLVTLPGI